MVNDPTDRDTRTVVLSMAMGFYGLSVSGKYNIYYWLLVLQTGIPALVVLSLAMGFFGLTFRLR